MIATLAIKGRFRTRVPLDLTKVLDATCGEVLGTRGPDFKVKHKEFRVRSFDRMGARRFIEQQPEANQILLFPNNAGLQLIGHDRPLWELTFTGATSTERLELEVYASMVRRWLEEEALPFMRNMAASDLDFTGELVHATQTLNRLPRAPGTGGYARAVVVRKADLEAGYDDPAVLFSKFSGIEDFGDRVLLTRHLDILDEEDLWNRVLDDAFDLWRHAKPHKTDWPSVFPLAPIPEWQHPRWFRNPRCTELVGIDGAGEAEFSAFVPPGRHLTPPDYGVLRGHAERKQDKNGDPVTGARVVFPFLDMAIPERRPLFDLGAKVYYVGANGDLVPVPEDG